MQARDICCVGGCWTSLSLAVSIAQHTTSHLLAIFTELLAWQLLTLIMYVQVHVSFLPAPLPITSFCSFEWQIYIVQKRDMLTL